MKKIILSVFLLTVWIGAAGATPTGLNNIPTTDVVPEKVLVLQGWSNFGHDEKPEYLSGFKYGPVDGIEIGADSKISPGEAGPLTLQFKCRFWEDDSIGLSALVGVENISTSDRAADENPYLVLSQDFKVIRAHLGCNLQDNQEGAFFGLDRTFAFRGQDLTLRGDIKQTNDQDDLLGSVGFMYTLPGNFILEGWVSSPSNSNLEVFTIKINYVF